MLRDPAITDDAVAQYTVALVARGTERKKLQSNLSSVLGEETTKELLDW